MRNITLNKVNKLFQVSYLRFELAEIRYIVFLRCLLHRCNRVSEVKILKIVVLIGATPLHTC
jgi:hypothetical protein